MEVKTLTVCWDCSHRAAHGHLGEMTELDYPDFCIRHEADYIAGLELWRIALGWPNIYIAEHSEYEGEWGHDCEICRAPTCDERIIDIYTI